MRLKRQRQKPQSYQVPMVHCPAGQFIEGPIDPEKIGLSGQVFDSWFDGTNPYGREPFIITKSFLIGQTQVTQAQWEAVMGSNPSEYSSFQMPRMGCSVTQPVENVNWFDCVRFCNALSEAEGLEPVYSIGSGDKPSVDLNLDRNGYRLPTAAEWEYAAKAGTDFAYAGSDNLDEVGWWRDHPRNELLATRTPRTAPKPVGMLQPNSWGIYDMSGNVSEWCHDVDKRDAGAEDRMGRWRSGLEGRATRGGSIRSSKSFGWVQGPLLGIGSSSSQDCTWNKGMRLCRSAEGDALRYAPIPNWEVLQPFFEMAGAGEATQGLELALSLMEDLDRLVDGRSNPKLETGWMQVSLQRVKVLILTTKWRTFVSRFDWKQRFSV